ncbi:hypothetical protein M405DRAFT_723912 [Rhizopogon salebrosus TDB-379]|nr:hypothetical protein M405DRAFT_723912 [Rhizopogon salebrosus TDB-379]
MTEVNVTQDYGAMLIGGLLAFSLSGCVNMQFIVYWRLYSDEPYHAKSLVRNLINSLLDLCHSAFVAVALWDSIIVPYGDFDMLDNIPWYVRFCDLLPIGCLMHHKDFSFFAYRIYRLQDKGLTVVVPIVVLAFCRLGKSPEWIHMQSYAAFVAPFPGWIFALGLSLSAFVDIMITTSLCYFLHKNRTMIAKLTIHMLDTLTFWTIQNGSITCAAAIASLLAWIGMPQNRIFLGLHFVVAKLYANSLLATLNARQKLRNGKQYNSADNRFLPIFFPEDFSNAPGASRLQHGFSVSATAVKVR